MLGRRSCVRRAAYDKVERRVRVCHKPRETGVARRDSVSGDEEMVGGGAG